MQHPIDHVLREERLFMPPEHFKNNAHLRSLEEYHRLWQESVDQPDVFWDRQAREHLEWMKPWKNVLEWEPPHAKWFQGGQINVSSNCIDRHARTWRKNKAALIWEGEPGDRRVITYGELLREVCQVAAALRDLGVKRGDRVTLYLPLVPELPIAMLACTRIGAVHSVVFAGFSSQALADRNNDAKAKVVITADGGWRKGAIVGLKEQVDLALDDSPTVKKTLVLRRTGQNITMKAGRDVWWHDAVESRAGRLDPEPMESEDPLFLLYTSGSTGKPKGILHTTAGYLLGATLSSRYVFDLKDTDTYWCTADAGWITGHSYLVYGPLSCGATVVLYEGAPLCPDPGRFWRMIERMGVTIFYTAPTAIRTFMRAGDEWPSRYDLSSLRLLGSVGEPINPKAWMWYRETIGGGRCPVVDTWWQTETGSIMITPIPGVTPTVPGSATLPFFGVDPQIVDGDGKPVETDQGGYLVINRPWPSMLRNIYGDETRFRQQYWQRFPGKYCTGDGARRDANGYFWIMGRIDDVLNISGHRLSTMEIESLLVGHSDVAEAAVVGIPHPIKGEGLVCFVTPKLLPKTLNKEHLIEALSEHLVKSIGPLARPDKVILTESLPKTRSGKIMRRILRDLAAGQETAGDVSTLEDRSVLQSLRLTDE